MTSLFTSIESGQTGCKHFAEFCEQFFFNGIYYIYIYSIYH